MSTFTQHRTELSNQLGLTETQRFSQQERDAAINQSLNITFGLLAGSPILKRSGTVTIEDGVAEPPDDFNEGAVYFMGTTDDFDSAYECVELDNAQFGRADSTDSDYFTQSLDEDGNAQFEFNTLGDGDVYIEYEMGAPTLSSANQQDNLPSKAIYIVAQLAAGILQMNLLNEPEKLNQFLYGPSGAVTRVAPTSVYGQLLLLRDKRRAKATRKISAFPVMNSSGERFNNYQYRHPNMWPRRR